MLGRKLHFDVNKYCVFKIKIKNDIIARDEVFQGTFTVVAFVKAHIVLKS